MNRKLIFFFLFLLPGVSSAATIAQDNFDSYADSDPMNGLSGGTGWDAAWAVTSGSTWQISDTEFVSSPLSAQVSSGATEPDIRRAVTSTTDGDIFYVKMRADSTANNQGIVLRDGSTYRVYVYLFHDGNINMTGNNIGTWTTDTWVTFAIHMDYTNDCATVSIDGGAEGSCYPFNGSTAGITNISLVVGNDAGGSHQYWWDDIELTDSSGPSGGGGGGGAATSTMQIVVNPNQDMFNAILLFFMSWFGIMWMLRRRV